MQQAAQPQQVQQVQQIQPTADEYDEDEEDEEDEEYSEDEEEDSPPAGSTEQCETRVINFDQYSTSAWDILNTSWYTKLSGSKQYDASGDVCDKVGKCVKKIQKQVKANSPYGTKMNALEALLEIADTVLSAGDTLGYEVRKQFQWDDCVPAAMMAIAEFMTPEERLKAGQNSGGRNGTLLERIDDVEGEAKGLCIEGLQVGSVGVLLGGTN